MRFGTIFIASIMVMSMFIFQGEGSGADDPDVSLYDEGLPSRNASMDPYSWLMHLGDPTHKGYSTSDIPKKNTTDILWGERVDSLMGTVSPVVYDGVLYVGSGTGHMKGFDIDTGAEVWDVFIGNHRIRAAATVNNGNIFFGADNGHIYGFEIATENKILDVDLGGSEIESCPLVVDGRLYVGVVGNFLKDHRFHAVDISSQTINWTLSMGDQENFYGFKETAAHKDGKLYIGDGNGTFYCLDVDGFWDGNDGPKTNETETSGTDPDIIWMRESDHSVLTDALLAEGKVYFGNDNGRLICLNSTDGTEVWRKHLGSGERSLQACPTYHEGRVYLTARNTVTVYEGASVYSLDPSTGSQIWRFNITGQIITESSPVVVDGALVFGSRNQKLYCISTIEENIADEDRILWTISTGSPITSTPAVADGRVFVTNEPMGTFGKVFAIGAPDPGIERVWISDPAPFSGERVRIGVDLTNNATVDCYVDIDMVVSNFNNSRQADIGTLQNVHVEAGGNTSVDLEWTVETGFDFAAAIIKDSIPEDRNNRNDLASMDLFVKEALGGAWTSSGSGPQRTSGSGRSLDSNRSFWELDLDSGWPADGSGSLWYDGIQENGSISSTGPALYFTGPDGDLISLETNPDEDTGVPAYSWRYSNSSVDFMGQPALLVDEERSMSGPNKVFSYGDDGALWAFDWVGMRDGINDGPFVHEPSTDAMAGDVIWRTLLPAQPSGPMLIGGGNVIFPGEDGNLRALDDDRGELLWTRSHTGDQVSMAYGDHLYFSNGQELLVLDHNTGDTVHTMELDGIPFPVSIRSLIATGSGLLVVASNGTMLLENHPVDETDDGFKDNSSGTDILWHSFLNGPLSAPPAISPDTSVICMAQGLDLQFIFLENGTLMANSSIPGELESRITAGGDSFYMITGNGPWKLRAFSPIDDSVPEPIWTRDLETEPMGEAIIVGKNMFLSTMGGRIISMGATNNRPRAVIGSPRENILVFPGEDFMIDASGSFDPDGDPLTYVWSMEGLSDPLIEGTDPTDNLSLSRIGKKKLILRVYDDMGSFGETYINVTVLKRITGPDFNDELYDVNVHMSYGISEPSGRGIVGLTVPEDLPDAPGSVFTCHLQFNPWPTYASYRFQWANVSIGYGDKEFKQKMNPQQLGIFYYESSREEWVRAPVSGTSNDSFAFGNFTSLRDGFYAIGILDNDPPELRHREIDTYRYQMLDSVNYNVRVEYRDPDNDLPSWVKLVVDNQTEYRMEDEGFSTTVTKWSFFNVEDVSLSPGDHTYYFEAYDGNFEIRSEYHHYFVGNNPPIPEIVGPTSVVNTGDVVLFDASGSTDPDGDEITFSWDFNDMDGIQKDKVGPKADHIYYEEGNYVVTLTVSDGVAKSERKLSITVIDPDEENGTDTITASLGILILVVIGILILSIIIFIVISKRGHEEETDINREFEGRWTCPECGERVPKGVEECPRCDYIYDPYDFEEEDMDMFEDMDEM